MRKYLAIIILSISIQSGFASDVITVPYITADMVYSRVHDKIYAIIDALDTEYGNRLLEINSSTGAIERSMFVGSQPVFIRLTSDENFAWISFYGEPFVKRVDLDVFQIDKKVYLGPSQLYNLPNVRNSFILCNNFTVLPGDNQLVIGLETVNVFEYEGVVLYRDDAVLPSRIRPNLDTWYFPRCFEPLEDTNYLVGHHQDSQTSIFSTIEIVDDGLEYGEEFKDLLEQGLKRNWIVAHNDTLCVADGTVLDATDISDIKVIGQCKNDVIGDLYGFTYSDLHQAYIYPNLHNDSIYLTFYDKNTFEAYHSVFLLEYPFYEIVMITQLEVIDQNRFAIEIGKDYGFFSILIIDTEGTGIRPVSPYDQLEIYPNPASDNIFIKGLPLNNRISIYDINGRLIETIENPGISTKIGLDNYLPGTYMLKITNMNDNSSQVTKKLVIIK